ncbi:MAG: futalosine hydrolase [Desulfobacteraceae bacterium 4572_130]|nr:MAG: futalosine hydrolase [Desulfobacteraceae bacterium 4572_130]
MKTNIIILAATKMEIAPFLKISKIISEKISCTGKTIIIAKYAEKIMKIAVTGVGIVNTAQTLTSLLEFHKPDIVIQIGIGGIFKQTSLKIGDIGVADSETYIHAGIETGDSSFDLAPLPFNLLKDDKLTRKGIFSVNSDFAVHAFNILSNYFAPRICNVTKGAFITVSSITATKNTAHKFFLDFNACMESMEGSGAAHVAAIYKTNFLEIRAGSNYVGKRDKSTWKISLAAQRASQALAVFLEKGDKCFESTIRAK